MQHSASAQIRGRQVSHRIINTDAEVECYTVGLPDVRLSLIQLTVLDVTCRDDSCLRALYTYALY